MHVNTRRKKKERMNFRHYNSVLLRYYFHKQRVAYKNISVCVYACI